MKYFLLLLISLNAFAGQTIKTDLVVQGKLKVESTSKGSQPCPVMTEVQRDAVASPQNGDCIFNSTAGTINIYSSTDLAWNEVSGSGGGDPGILTNGGFEKGIASWTLASGTASFTTTDKIELKQALDIALTAQTLSLKQISTLNASALSGLQGLAYAYIKAPAGAVIKLCAIQNSVTSTTYCDTKTGDGSRKLYKIPFTLNGTNNGLEILSSAAITGTVNVDKAWVGAVDLKQEGDSSRFVGSLKYTGAANCAWISSATSFTNNTADTDCVTPVATGSIQAPSTKVPAFILPGSLGSGDYEVTVNGLLYSSSTGIVCGWRISDGTISSDVSSTYVAGTGAASGAGSQVFRLAVSGASDRTFHLQTNASGASCVIDAGVANRQELSFQIKKLASSSTYSSTNADTDWASCGHTTSSFTGFGTVSAIETQCKRQGGDLLVKGGWTSGTTTAVPGSFSLPLWNGVQLASKGTSIIPTIQVAGKGVISTAATTFFGGVTALIEPSSTQVFIGAEGSTVHGLTKTNASVYASSGQKFSFGQIRIPIEGWENSNVIIGQFNGLESCTDSYQCTDTFSASIAGFSSSGGVSAENLDWINGNCTASSGTVTCPIKSGVFTVLPNCSFAITSTAAAQRSVQYDRPSSTINSLVFKTMDSTTLSNLDFTVICQKQGVDYIGKTAKAVASDQNLRTPGVTKAVVVSAYVAANGSVSREFGDFFNGNCTNANPRVCTFNTSFWVDIPNCQIQTDTGGASATNNTAHIEAFSTSSLTFRTMNGTTGTAMPTFVTCHGYTP